MAIKKVTRSVRPAQPRRHARTTKKPSPAARKGIASLCQASQQFRVFPHEGVEGLSKISLGGSFGLLLQVLDKFFHCRPLLPG